MQDVEGIIENKEKSYAIHWNSIWKLRCDMGTPMGKLNTYCTHACITCICFYIISANTGFYFDEWLNTMGYSYHGNTAHHPQVSLWFLHTRHLSFFMK
jgi:hypothetical protein